MEETREQWIPRGDAGVFCRERNAKQPLDTVRSYTGFASSCLDTFCNGNSLIKNKAWSVEPLAMGDDSHLGGRCPGCHWRERPRFSVAN